LVLYPAHWFQDKHFFPPTELGAMEPVNTYELANQVGSIIERSARSEINGRNVAFDKGVNGAPEEIYYAIYQKLLFGLN
jgi:hypothetical protein